MLPKKFMQNIIFGGIIFIKYYVNFFFSSSLPNCEKITGGKYKVPHFTKKAEIEEYIKTKKMSSTFVHAGINKH